MALRDFGRSSVKTATPFGYTFPLTKSESVAAITENFRNRLILVLWVNVNDLITTLETTIKCCIFKFSQRRSYSNMFGYSTGYYWYAQNIILYII